MSNAFMRNAAWQEARCQWTLMLLPKGRAKEKAKAARMAKEKAEAQAKGLSEMLADTAADL